MQVSKLQQCCAHSHECNNTCIPCTTLLLHSNPRRLFQPALTPNHPTCALQSDSVQFGCLGTLYAQPAAIMAVPMPPAQVNTVVILSYHPYKIQNQSFQVQAWQCHSSSNLQDRVSNTAPCHERHEQALAA
jgi:hypothetical protein